MILHRPFKSNHSDIVSLAAVFGSFVLGSILLHRLAGWLELDGLPSFLVYTIPFWVLISWATARAGESLPRSLVRNGLWGYSFILAIACVALFLG
ncbi:MAG: hypothetical protein F4Z15_07025 [Gammaproteobacteria bacterium]|nr:hypothetical protein [Gammaproteobacteria bacterium]MYD75337.1 hypothetical protein [Gammaproteobacteria bacterium]MYJ51431.1 hypothetical protein [Gammaproteobacteria bacterium]